jgi:hypothetical protein
MQFKSGFLVLVLAISPAFGQTPAPASPETERIVMRHMDLVQKGDLATMLTDMSDPCTLIGVAGARVFTHADMIKRFSAQFARRPPQRIDLVAKAFFGNIGYVVYTADPGTPEAHQFSETFFIRDGKIIAYANTQFDKLRTAPAAAAAPPK